MTQTPTRGMQITIDHAAAAPEAPAMIPPKMTCTTCYHLLSFLAMQFRFYRNFPITFPPSSSGSRSACSADSHFQFHFAQRKTARFPGQSHFQYDFQHFVRTHTGVFVFSSFTVCSAVLRVFLFDTGFLSSMTALAPPLLPQITVLHRFLHSQLAQINNR